MQPRPRTTRGPAKFTQADVRRAIRGAQAANLPIGAIKITPTGDILVIPGTPEVVAASTHNPLDDL